MSTKKQKTFPKIGEVYYIKLDGNGSEQAGYRPCLVFQNNIGNQYSPNLIVLPLTSKLKKTNQPTHIVLPAQDTGLRLDSMVLCENPVCVSKDKLGYYVTTIPQEYMTKVAVGYLLATAAISFIQPDNLHDVWEQSLALNAVA